MREGLQNGSLAFGATDQVRWRTNSETGPDAIQVTPQRNERESQPIPMQGMEIATFQLIYEHDYEGSEHGFGLSPYFQVSQDGRHWDDIPDDSFGVDLSTVIVDGETCTSVTIAVLTTSNYIRLGTYGQDVPGHSETEPNPGDLFFAYVTLKEA